MIVGAPGSGKSTLARRLGECTGLPVFHMDRIHYRPGWVERSRDAKDALTREVHVRERWIFEGGHSRTYPERIARADTFVWLDLPVGLRFYRVVRRTITTYGRTRPDLADGCPERFGPETLAFWHFIWRTRHTARAKLLAIHDDPPAHLRVVRLSDRREIDTFVQSARPSSDE